MVPRAAAAATAMLVYSLLSSDLVSSSQARKRKKKKIDQDMKQSAVFVLSWTASSIFCCVEVKRVAMRSKETHVMQRDSQLQANERAGLWVAAGDTPRPSPMPAMATGEVLVLVS